MGFALRTIAAAFVVVLAGGAAQAMDSSSVDLGPSSDELFKRAQKSIDVQRYKEAIEDLQKVVKDKPKNADAFNLLGYSNRKLGQYDLAMRYYTKALDPIFLPTVWNSFRYALLTTVLSLAIGYPVAYWSHAMAAATRRCC